jgi:NAD(P)H-dependent flavin oxidoreductase YrpB (nitropropane dioxygenase family)
VEEMREAIRKIRDQTDRPFGVDLLLPRDMVLGGDSVVEGPKEIPLREVLKTLPRAHYEWFLRVKEEMKLPDIDTVARLDSTTMRPLEAVKACIEERIPLFCAGLGNPGFMVEEAHANGIKVLGITGNAKNAKRMAQSGLDLIVAQGHEGGGHTGRIGTMALLPQAIDAAYPVPVLGAGGIGDGRGVAAALAMGCAGVWVGTRFLATREGGALEIHKQKILESTDEDTRRTYWYTGKTSRASYNKFHDLMENAGLDPLPFPTQVMLASALVESLRQAGKEDYLGAFAGQISGLIKEIKPARQVLEEMVEQAVDILARRLPQEVTAR